MVRVKRSVVARRRHKKILKEASGYYGARSRVFRVAKQSVIKAGQYAYIGRKLKKRFFRSVWIMRINAVVRLYGMTYSTFIAKVKNIVALNKKSLATIAVHDKEYFKSLVDLVRKSC